VPGYESSHNPSISRDQRLRGTHCGEAAGGFLGFGEKVSEVETEVMKTISDALGTIAE
tara:strand:+ start:284 stop:457 length:174 start_codon:yes stop_codon:yes gene_type:complete